MKKVSITSANIKEDSLIKLRRVFPQLIKDNQIDFDALKAFFDEEGIIAGEGKYGLNWSGKSKAIQAIHVPSIGTLTPQPKDSVAWDKTENLFIEGDNLEVLKLLQKHYREKIKMIYIDPPYNTGKDKIYRDNFKENITDYYERSGQTKDGIKMTSNSESRGRYHSDWLTMMYPRLFFAKSLLRDDGVIFVSIDDNEVHNLRHIMDEIFGQENFVGQLIIRSNPRGSQEPTGISHEHEYILCYIKSDEGVNTILGYKRTQSDSEFSYKTKEGKRARLLGLRKRGGDWRQSDRKNMYYPFYVNPKDFTVSLEKSTQYKIEVYPIRPEGKKSRWTWGPKTAQKRLNELIGKKISRNGENVYDIYRIDTLEDEKDNIKREKVKSIWLDKTLNYQFARQYFKEYFGNSEIFDFPKSPYFVINLLRSLNDESGIILDFFAGSGTTGDAVMDLNSQDGGDRKWICVQLPEITDEKSEARKAGFNTIAEIARERIRRAGKKIKKGDIGFKAYSLKKSNYRQWQMLDGKADEKKLKQQMKLVLDKPLVDGFDESSVIYEILLKEGFSLNSQVKSEKLVGLPVWVVTDEDKKLVVSFAKSLIKDQIEKLDLKSEDTFVCFDSALNDTIKVNIIRNLNVKVI